MEDQKKTYTVWAAMCRALGRKNNSIMAALARLALLDAAIEDGRLEADGPPRRPTVDAVERRPS